MNPKIGGLLGPVWCCERQLGKLHAVPNCKRMWYHVDVVTQMQMLSWGVKALVYSCHPHTLWLISGWLVWPCRTWANSASHGCACSHQPQLLLPEHHLGPGVAALHGPASLFPTTWGYTGLLEWWNLCLGFLVPKKGCRKASVEVSPTMKRGIHLEMKKRWENKSNTAVSLCSGLSRWQWALRVNGVTSHPWKLV